MLAHSSETDIMYCVRFFRFVRCCRFRSSGLALEFRSCSGCLVCVCFCVGQNYEASPLERNRDHLFVSFCLFLLMLSFSLERASFIISQLFVFCFGMKYKASPLERNRPNALFVVVFLLTLSFSIERASFRISQCFVVLSLCYFVLR